LFPLRKENLFAMKNSFICLLTLVLSACLANSCDRYDVSDPEARIDASLPEIAGMLSSLPLETEHLREVFDAVCESSANGYDEEYTMENVFANPGAGVGESLTKRSGTYVNPLRNLISRYYQEHPRTKGTLTDAGVESLPQSGCQIYWPYHENWDGKTLPIITFDPGADQSVNVGYEITEDENGERSVQSVMVDEATAMKRPVWVVNTNSDAGYVSLEMLRRRSDSEWATGGDIKVNGGTKSGADAIKTLVLKDFTMNRQFDPWFRGGSEFFVKVGSVDGFTAKTEDDMRLYQPSVTDFMIVIKRRQKGIPVPFNAILVSDWTDQMESVAFLISEDDGGTQTSWKATAVVKVKSKSYGIELDIPINDKDDIVWRGSLAGEFIEKYAGEVQHFGDVDLTFDFI